MRDKRFLLVSYDFPNERELPLPLSLGYIGSALLEVGVDVEFLCADVMKYSPEYIRDYIANNKFDFVGMGFTSARFNRFRPIIRMIREGCTAAGSLFVLGGHALSAAPAYILQETGADIGVVGEGDVTIKELGLFYRPDSASFPQRLTAPEVGTMLARIKTTLSSIVVGDTRTITIDWKIIF